jgi:hypothetical protein
MEPMSFILTVRQVLFSTSAAVAITAGSAAWAQNAPSLPAFNADIRDSSISGISSGAFMAVQFGVAWSSTVKGVGAVAGGPFFCAQGAPGSTIDSGSIASTMTAVQNCMQDKPSPPDIPALIQATDAFAESGQIDDPANIKRQKIYMFSGYNDKVVVQPVVNTLRRYYAHYLTPNGVGNLFYQSALGAGHSQVTADFGSACNVNEGHFINNCNYDQAGIILQHIYGRLAPKNTTRTPGGQVVPFTQRDFIGGGVVPPKTFGMAETGFAYIPAACSRGVHCRVHVALHGCLQNAETIQQDYILHAGYNEWADTNAIIVLYPQTTATNKPPSFDPTAPLNPNGCWDWFGFTDSNYATKTGSQIVAIKAMLDRLTQGGQAIPTPTLTAGPPSGLQAIDSSDTTIDVVWSPVAGVPAYDVFRQAPGQDFVAVGRVAGSSFGDSGLSPAVKYSYKVAGTGTPAFSDPVSKATLPVPPRCADPGSCAIPN